MQDEEQQRDEDQAPEEQPEGTPEEQQAEEQQAPEEQRRPRAAAPSAARARHEPRLRRPCPRTRQPRTTRPPRSRAATSHAPRSPRPPPEGSGKKEDVVPGAELDPIAIEPERQLDPEERARREAEEEERLRRERELIGEVDQDAPVAAQPAKLEGDASYAATGKRKSSIARVILRPGSGTIQVNKRTLEEYFPRSYLQSLAKQPLTQTGYEGNVDVRVRVHGGGVSGQAAAVRHGIARALVDVDPALRPELKRRGMLTRDARVKERRKAGLKKARKRPQFSKR